MQPTPSPTLRPGLLVFLCRRLQLVASGQNRLGHRPQPTPSPALPLRQARRRPPLFLEVVMLRGVVNNKEYESVEEEGSPGEKNAIDSALEGQGRFLQCRLCMQPRFESQLCVRRWLETGPCRPVLG